MGIKLWVYVTITGIINATKNGQNEEKGGRTVPSATFMLNYRLDCLGELISAGCSSCSADVSPEDVCYLRSILTLYQFSDGFEIAVTAPRECYIMEPVLIINIKFNIRRTNSARGIRNVLHNISHILLFTKNLPDFSGRQSIIY